MFISKVCGTNKQNFPKNQLNSSRKLSYPQDSFSNSVNFSGFNNVTSLGQKNIKGRELNLHKLLADHETYFYRNPEIIGQAAKHLRANYPDGAFIINPFSSIGEEARTLSILLASKRYQILSIDLMDEVVKKAQKGEHSISSKAYQYKYNAASDDISIFPADAFLLEQDKKLTPKQLEFKKRFFKRFTITASTPNEITVLAKANAFPNIRFIQGNVQNISQIIANESQNQNVGAFVAQNGFYHILGNNKDVINGNLVLSSAKDCHLDKFKKIISDIHSELDENGILVFGNLDRDHLNQEDLQLFENKDFLQNLNERQNHYTESSVHKIITACGFEPIYYAPCETPSPILKSKNILLPAIFKKSTN